MANEGDETLNPLPWRQRSSSMPSLPGAANGWLELLRGVLTQVAEGSGIDPEFVFNTPGSSRRLTAKDYASQLGAAHLMTRATTGAIQVTPYAREWLLNGRPDYLALIFHRHVRFVGELLAELEVAPRSVSDLTNAANEKYKLGWRSADSVRRRITWLRILELIEETGSNSYRLSQSGRDLLDGIAIEQQAAAWAQSNDTVDVVLPVQPAEISSLLSALRADSTQQDKRKHVVAYVPSVDGQSVIDSLRSLTSAGIPSISQKDFDIYCADVFSIKASSASSALTTLRAMGLYEPIGKSMFSATAAAREWIESTHDVDLVRILHINIRFVGELLSHVDSINRVPQLHEKAVSAYGLQVANTSTVATILRILRACGAVTETGYAQYRLTKLGAALGEELPLMAPSGSGERELTEGASRDAESVERRTASSLTSELISASTASQNSQRFESLIADAFTFLGQRSVHLGGPGNTDVIVHVGVGSITYGTAIIDAKTAGSGMVGENAINFQALHEHKVKHGATLAAVIGPAFQPGRLEQWAKDNKVVLISVSQLEEVLRHHETSPLGPEDLVMLFDVEQGWDVLQAKWAALDRRSRLLNLVVDCFVRETEENDPVLGSSLDIVSLYRAVRDQIAPKPDTSELQEILDFLTMPFVGAIAASKAGYELRESPATTARRLISLGVVVGRTS